MGRKITVAEGGDPTAPFMEGLRHPDDFQRPWEERHKAEIEIDDSDTLGAILKRGNEALGSELPPETHDTYAFVDFFVEGRSSIKFRNELVLLDREGHVRWTWKWAWVRSTASPPTASDARPGARAPGRPPSL